MKYSYNQNKDGVVFANLRDINASFKDLGAVCASIRYKPVQRALDDLDRTITGEAPILYKKYNASMGSRHELGGKKGRWPKKCASIVKKVLINAAANARNKGFDPEAMYVVHAAANKTNTFRRMPPKGALVVITGLYSHAPTRYTDLEFSRVEIGISMMDDKRLSRSTVNNIKYTEKNLPKMKKIEKKEEKKGKKGGKEKEQKEKKPLITKEQPKNVLPEVKKEEKQKLPEVKKEEPKQVQEKKPEQTQPAKVNP